MIYQIIQLYRREAWNAIYGYQKFVHEETEEPGVTNIVPKRRTGVVHIFFPNFTFNAALVEKKQAKGEGFEPTEAQQKRMRGLLEGLASSAKERAMEKAKKDAAEKAKQKKKYYK